MLIQALGYEALRARSHTVTTTASSFAENFSTTSSSFAYDREFLRTLPGLLIVAEIPLLRVGQAAGGQSGAETKHVQHLPQPPSLGSTRVTALEEEDHCYVALHSGPKISRISIYDKKGDDVTVGPDYRLIPLEQRCIWNE
ncbi:hypothetical protein CB1_001185015 [Camelus ferus]|nr:hypothetical protein CB1_001185015 [Camelus ferus]